ncbi:hypothetical protein ATANTOWER_021122 [Ataeniobius toweri]|uniref:Uncharacterized protein n=1 Tax=Ataeniobius toweri TaxID=208326 RepID=A0ABU7BAS7_9TELE|nr:hypothetical protein [Ataeniobius toweri]
MTLCSLCSLPSLRTSVDLLRTLWPVDEPSIVSSRTMASVTVLYRLTLHTLTYTHTHMLKVNICTPSAGFILQCIYKDTNFRHCLTMCLKNVFESHKSITNFVH